MVFKTLGSKTTWVEEKLGNPYLLSVLIMT